MMTSKRLLAVAVSAALYAPLSAFATNGMNMEGYGPIATGMGGASMAYDNGTAAMANNPATLGLMADNNRFDIAIGVLSPDITVKTTDGSMKWDSDATQFLMPAMGYAHKSDKLVFGAGVFAQGGMGTEYKGGGPGGAFAAQEMALSTTYAANAIHMINPSDLMSTQERSEVGVGRLIFPVAYNVNDALTIGGSLDYVWATMDIQWLMPGSQMGALMADGSLTGTMVSGLQSFMTAGYINNVYGGYFDFSDNNDFNGETRGTGFAGKLGFTYKVSPALSLGGTYHSKTALGDLEGRAEVSMAVSIDTGIASGLAPSGSYMDAGMTVKGKIKIVDFEWPQTFGMGASYKASDKWTVNGDVKFIQWSDTMKNFKMAFAADNAAYNGAFAGATMNATLKQNWDDQTVIQLGAAYAATDAATIRFGYNYANNPVPDKTLNYLFPAIVKQHYTLGMGYKFSQASDVNLSLVYAPAVEQSNPAGFTVSHAQTNYQVMYSYRF